MSLNAPVVIIEDDIDDQDILKEVFTRLGYKNELCFFGDGQSALDYLTNTDVIPFLILSDINLPKLSGFDLRQKIREDVKLELRCIPYLFFTTASTQKAVIDAYSMSAQGFFVKGTKIAEIEKTIQVIMEYWQRCTAPNKFLSPEEEEVADSLK